MTTKFEGFQNRQRDIGWGYAVAHYIPFVGIYYAFTRRTITPLLYYVLGNLLVSFTYGMIIGIMNPKYDEGKLENSANIIGLVLTPLLAKSGIEKARNEKKSI